MTTKSVTTLSPAHLADRQKGLGGSDAAAALGLSPWKTPLQLYLEKRGEIDLEDLSDREYIEWGVRNEPAIRQKYADETGRTVVMPKGTIFHPGLPWMLCHPDGLVLDEKPRRITSFKNADVHVAAKWGEPGTADVPQDYFIQAQHEMVVHTAAALAVGEDPFEVVDLAVLIGGNRWRLYLIPADAEIQAMIVDGETEFMGAVTTGSAPAPDFNARSTRALIQKLFPGTNGEVLQATENQVAWRTVMDDANAKAKVYDVAAEAAKSALLFDMGEAAELRFPDGKALRRKLIQKKGFTVEPTSYIDARFASVKE